jgi:hypothetical protein
MRTARSCSAFWGRVRFNGQQNSAFYGRKAAGAAPIGNYAVRLRHSGGAWPYLWRTEFSSAKKGRFSEALSAFRGRTLGILGAHNPICTCTTPSSRLPAVVEMWEFYAQEPRRLPAGEKSDLNRLMPRMPHAKLSQCDQIADCGRTTRISGLIRAGRGFGTHVKIKYGRVFQRALDRGDQSCTISGRTSDGFHLSIATQMSLHIFKPATFSLRLVSGAKIAFNADCRR